MEVISGHYPAHVQCALLSAGVRTIHDALNLLQKLKPLETGGGRNSNPGPSAQNRTNVNDSNTPNAIMIKVMGDDPDSRM
jgi:hypothetical protein